MREPASINPGIQARTLIEDGLESIRRDRDPHAKWRTVTVPLEMTRNTRT